MTTKIDHVLKNSKILSFADYTKESKKNQNQQPKQKFQLGDPIKEPTWLLKIFILFDVNYHFFRTDFEIGSRKYNALCYVWIETMRSYTESQILNAWKAVFAKYPHSYPNAEKYSAVINQQLGIKKPMLPCFKEFKVAKEPQQSLEEKERTAMVSSESWRKIRKSLGISKNMSALEIRDYAINHQSEYET